MLCGLYLLNFPPVDLEETWLHLALLAMDDRGQCWVKKGGPASHRLRWASAYRSGVKCLGAPELLEGKQMGLEAAFSGSQF